MATSPCPCTFKGRHMAEREWHVINPGGTRRVVVTKELPGDRWLQLLTAAGCRVEVAQGDDLLGEGEIRAAIGDRAWTRRSASCRRPGRPACWRRSPRPAARCTATTLSATTTSTSMPRRVLRLPVGNTPGVLTETTAELAVALTFAAARRIPEGDRFMRAGRYHGWLPRLLLGDLLCGRHARRDRRRPHRRRLRAHDARGPQDERRVLRRAPQRGTGVVRGQTTAPSCSRTASRWSPAAGPSRSTSCCATPMWSASTPSLAESTRHLIGAEQLALMKEDAVLVNASRGPLIDEAALVEHCRTHPRFSAALDVYEDEPAMKPGLAESRQRRPRPPPRLGVGLDAARHGDHRRGQRGRRPQGLSGVAEGRHAGRRAALSRRRPAARGAKHRQRRGARAAAVGSGGRRRRTSANRIWRRGRRRGATVMTVGRTRDVAERVQRLGTETAFAVSAEANEWRETGPQGLPVPPRRHGPPTPQNIMDAAERAMRDGKTGYCPNAGILPLREALAADVERLAPARARPAERGHPAGRQARDRQVHPRAHEPGRRGALSQPGLPDLREPDRVPRRRRAALRLRRGCTRTSSSTSTPWSGKSRRAPACSSSTTCRTRPAPRARPQSSNGSPSSPCGTTLVVLSDEAYWDIRYSGESQSIASLPDMAERTVILYTFSKKFAMTGWRLGAAIGPKPYIDVIAKLNVNDETCSNHFVQYGALEGLTGDQSGPRHIVETLRERRDARRRPAQRDPRRALLQARGDVLPVPQRHGADGAQGSRGRTTNCGARRWSRRASASAPVSTSAARCPANSSPTCGSPTPASPCPRSKRDSASSRQWAEA